jgi:hypothetical protein
MNRILGVLAAGLALVFGVATGVGLAQVSLPSNAPQQPVPPKQKSVSKTVPKAAPAPAQSSSSEQDKQIEAVIRAKLAKSKIGQDGLTVRVQGGVAYWEGSTSVVQHKGSATRMAKTAGARAVVNKIKVSDAAKQKAAENLDQGRRRAQVKRSEPRTEQ